MPSIVEAVPLRTNMPDGEAHLVRFVGGSAAVTKQYGIGITVTYISTGVVDLTWGTGANKPGEFLGAIGTFAATTPADVKTYTLVPNTYNATTCTLRLSMYEGGTLADLAALEWLTVIAFFTKLDL